jgi:hypothetical protein
MAKTFEEFAAEHEHFGHDELHGAWYLSPACPLCDTLRRLMDKQHGLTGKES